MREKKLEIYMLNIKCGENLGDFFFSYFSKFSIFYTELTFIFKKSYL